MKVVLDSRGMAAMLKSAGVATVVDNAASAVAAAAAAAPEITRHGMPISTGSGTSDRARAIVTIAHPGGIGAQAKHGTLSKAVSAAGLSLRKRPS